MSKFKIVIYAVVISIVIFEAGYRIYKDFLQGFAYPRLREFYFDNISGQRRPGSSAAYDNPEKDYLEKFPVSAEVEYNTYLGFRNQAPYEGSGYKINKYHFRYDDDFPAAKEEDEIRVFITGGSAAWGFGVDQEKLYSTIIENLLQDTFPEKKIRVICAATNGYCSTSERIVIENFILPLSPDFVIMFSGYNDTYVGYRGDSIFETNGDHFNYRKKLDKKEGRYKYYDAPRYKEYIFKLHYLVDKAIYNLRFSKQGRLKKIIDEHSIDSGESFNNLLRNVHIINTLSKAYDFKLIFYLQPTALSTNKPLSDYEKYIIDHHNKRHVGFADYSSRTYDLYRQMFPGDAAKNGYIFIDGDTAIREEERTVFIDYCHFGDRGNKILADHIYSFLKNLLLPEQ